MTDTATKAVDLVGVFDTDLNQVFQDARPLRMSIVDNAMFFAHPLESSATRTDHIIFLPVEATMSLIMSGKDYTSVYKQIKQAFRSQIELIVQSKTDTYENMYIQGMPHEDTPETFDSVIINLSIKETKLSNTVIVFAPESLSDTDTKNRGQQEPGTPTDAQEQRGSTLSRWFG